MKKVLMLAMAITLFATSCKKDSPNDCGTVTDKRMFQGNNSPEAVWYLTYKPHNAPIEVMVSRRVYDNTLIGQQYCP